MSARFLSLPLILTSMFIVRAAALGEVAPPKPVAPLPSPSQLAWQRAETVMFLHFGMNTFTDREWGEGKERERLFNPSHLDAGQWVKTAKAAGFNLLILTAKHHDGFCLWPSRFTEHSVKNSPWKSGKGDVVKEFTDACRAERVKAGLYLSPWDRNQPAYGDSPKYNEYYRNQLTELLSNYGPVAEVWFDGACGEGPNGKRQQYDWPSYYGLIRKLQPQALIAICGPDIRWVGNESGLARENETSVQPAPPEMRPGKRAVWYPAECDVSIRPGWFWHAREDRQVKSLSDLMKIYFASVGRNSNLLLNVPPNVQGRLSDADVARLAEFKTALDRLYGVNLAAGRPVRASNVRGGSDRYAPGKALDGDLDTYWATDDSATNGWLEVDLGQPRTFDVVRIQEAIALGVAHRGPGRRQVANALPGNGHRTEATAALPGGRGDQGAAGHRSRAGLPGDCRVRPAHHAGRRKIKQSFVRHIQYDRNRTVHANRWFVVTFPPPCCPLALCSRTRRARRICPW